MSIYKIRIIRPNKPNIKETIKERNFKRAVRRAKRSYRAWLARGYDVQIFNPGEDHEMTPEQFRG